MQLDELQSVRDRERQTDKLQQLRESFYVEAGEFIQQLRAERDRAAERAEDPFDAPEVNRLTDEINTAEQTVEAIYEKRVGKIVKAASFAAADLPAEADGMTAEEQELFSTLVSDIKENRQRVLDVLAGETDDTGGAPTDTAGAPTNADATPADSPAPTDTGAADTSAPPESGARERGPQEANPDRLSSTDSSATGRTDSEQSPPADGGTERPPSRDSASPDPSGTDSEGVPAADLMGSDDGATTAERDREVPPPPEAEGEKLRNDGGDIEAADAGTPATNTTQPTEPATAEQSAAADRAGTTAAEQSSTAQESVERKTVRVTDDIDTFVGSDDRDYDLAPDDVVTLPAANAEILIERDAAERL